MNMHSKAVGIAIALLLSGFRLIGAASDGVVSKEKTFQCRVLSSCPDTMQIDDVTCEIIFWNVRPWYSAGIFLKGGERINTIVNEFPISSLAEEIQTRLSRDYNKKDLTVEAVQELLISIGVYESLEKYKKGQCKYHGERFKPT